MIKKLIILIVIVSAIWFASIYYNQNNKTKEIILKNNSNSEVVNKNKKPTTGTSTTIKIPEIKTLEEKAQVYCNKENVSAVYISKDKIKIISNLIGSGTTYIPLDEISSFRCPVVAPDSMTDKCKTILNMPKNSWKKICSNEIK